MNQSINLVCVADKKYLPYLKIMLKSLKLSESDVEVHANLINIKSKGKVSDDLKKIYEKIHFNYIDRIFKKSHIQKAFCANYRAEAVYRLMKRNVQKIIYIDVDSLFRKNLGLQEKTLFDDCDIKIHFRDEDDPRFKVAAGVILVKNSKKSQEFIKSWSKELSKRQLEWFADQITLHEAIERHKNDLKFKHLDDAFIDWEFKKSSVIWVGKGNRKKNNITYLIETFEIQLEFLIRSLF